MDWRALVAGVFLLLALAALLYWQLDLAEGVYLGTRVVVWLYDRYARRYDVVKQFNEKDEAWFLGGPLAQALSGVTTARVLDVATGTARMPLTLLRQPAFTGQVIGLDLSRQMLRQAVSKTGPHRDRLTLLWQNATQLPFLKESFDAVTCLEALEFLPDAQATLTEMVRVLRPGGMLLVSNRVGPGTRWMPGRTMSREALTALLESLALTNVRINPWQVDYDIVTAHKSAEGSMPESDQPAPLLPATLPNLLRCPRCAAGPLTRQNRAFSCAACGSRYPIAQDGVIEMALDPISEVER